ncbi:hypothetical protein BDF21DRAFT_495729 [Thamnidium elegans]|nr:hypothetical protein BDF21DRAFT_495729 [Thamnidium elegans]
MASNSRKPSIQPRPTKASMLRLQKQQASTASAVQTPEPEPPTRSVPRATTNTTTSSTKSNLAPSVGATDGVKAFMAQQRARLVKKPSVTEEPVKKKTFMTGAQRYGGGDDKKETVTPNRSIQVIIKQAKSQGKLNISSRGLKLIPKEVLNMYHVDPNSIVVDFTSDAGGWYDAVELTKFVAGDNEITEMDSRIGEEFGALTHIDFRDNKLASVPDTLKLLKNLTCIHLPYNKFESIPKVLFQLDQLKELDLSHNQLKQVVLGSHSIEQLDLSHNEISQFSLDSNIDQDLSCMRKLNLGSNQITELPVGLTSWFKLQELMVNQNKLKFVFSAVSETVYPALVRLDASNNQMTSINKDTSVIVSMPKLVELSLLNNKFTQDGLTGLYGAPNIQTLDISSNQLDDIPASVTGLASLKRLDVRGNHLHALPYELGKLDQLSTIHCEGNPMRTFTSMSQTQLISSLRSSYAQQVEESSVEQVEVASEQQDTEETLCVNFTQKVNLTMRLDLSKQQLNEITTESMKFTQDIPAIILLNHNEFTSFPMKLSLISDFIVQLNLEHNKMTSFDFTLDGVVFHSIKTLKLNNNRIKSLQSNATTVSFPKLEELTLSHNALTSLPTNLAAVLPSLKTLSISSNKLDDITETSFGLRLEVLDLSNNDIGYLPPGLSNIESLKELIVYGNRFRVPRPAVVEQGTRAILDFLKRRNTPAN